ncbi:DNA cytosine methyltransferase [Vibrio splendidus]
MKDFLCLDAFCGAGGLSLGLNQAGFKIVYSFDKDPLTIKTLESNPSFFTHLIEEKAIEDLSSEQLLQKLDIRKGELTLVSGGPPCQGFSIQRIGSDKDDRNTLIFNYINLVLDLNPRFFLMENVPGIVGKRGQALLENALNHAEKNGYFIHKEILDAQNFQVPQRRKRVFIIGERKDYKNPKFKFPKEIKGKVTVRDTIAHLPSPPLDGSCSEIIKHHRRDRLSEKNLARLTFLKQGQGMKDLPEHLLADCHKVGAEKIGHRNVYGRMKWDDVAPTITARFDSFTRGQFAHPEDNRSISLKEGALLQTFPDDYDFSGNKVDIARQIGNAVPPKLASYIGLAILKVENGI